MNEKEKIEYLNPEKMYQNWIDKYLNSKLDTIKKIPPEQRKIETLDNYGYRMSIKNLDAIPESSFIDPSYKGKNRKRFTEYFFDFDDTLFNTTGYQESTWSLLEDLGISREKIDKTYDDAKIICPETGKRTYDQNVFIKKLQEEFSHKAEEIRRAMNSVNLEDFVNEDMAELMRLLTSHQISRVHILTFGKLEEQKRKIEPLLGKFGIPVDILYTQVSKAEFLKRYLAEQYPYIGEENSQSFVIIDDNPEELERLQNLSKEIPFFVPVRLRKPTAKRFKKEQIGDEKTPEIKEHYEKAILEIGRVVRLLREKKSSQEWKSENLSQLIQSHIDKNREPVNVTITEMGTILLYYETESFPGSNKFVNIKHELLFNNDSNIIEELIRDESGRVIERKKFLPSYTESFIE